MELRRKIALWICPELMPSSASPKIDGEVKYTHLITLAERFAEFTCRSEATISNKCAGHARLFSRLRSGKGCNVSTFNSTVGWFSNNWPSDLEWPRSIPRPKPTKKEAA